LRKLHADGALFGLVQYLLRQRWSPEQIALVLARIYLAKDGLKIIILMNNLGFPPYLQQSGRTKHSAPARAGLCHRPDAGPAAPLCALWRVTGVALDSAAAATAARRAGAVVKSSS